MGINPKSLAAEACGTGGRLRRSRRAAIAARRRRRLLADALRRAAASAGTKGPRAAPVLGPRTRPRRRLAVHCPANGARADSAAALRPDPPTAGSATACACPAGLRPRSQPRVRWPAAARRARADVHRRTRCKAAHPAARAPGDLLRRKRRVHDDRTPTARAARDAAARRAPGFGAARAGGCCRRAARRGSGSGSGSPGRPGSRSGVRPRRHDPAAHPAAVKAGGVPGASSARRPTPGRAWRDRAVRPPHTGAGRGTAGAIPGPQARRRHEREGPVRTGPSSSAHPRAPAHSRCAVCSGRAGGRLRRLLRSALVVLLGLLLRRRCGGCGRRCSGRRRGRGRGRGRRRLCERERRGAGKHERGNQLLHDGLGGCMRLERLRVARAVTVRTGPPATTRGGL